MAWQLATERERVFFILNMHIQYTHVCLQTGVISKMLPETNILQLGTWQKINWLNIIKRESILPLNQKFTVFLLSNRTYTLQQFHLRRWGMIIYYRSSNMDYFIYTSNPIFMEQTQPNDNLFLTESKHSPSKCATWKCVPKHRTFPWRKLKITKCERHTIETSVNSSFIRESVFYYLEQFVLDLTRDIIFSTRSSKRFKQ